MNRVLRPAMVAVALGAAGLALWSCRPQRLAGDGGTQPFAADQPALPPGHPALLGGHPRLSATQPTSPSGSRGKLIVRTVQGTAGGVAVAGDSVAVELYGRGGLLKRLEAKLDEQGSAAFEDIPVDRTAQPVITVTHAGMPYQAVGRIMNADCREQRVELNVYETTDTAPPWTVVSRQVVITARLPAGVIVRDTLVIRNPTDRTWIGKAEADGRRTTLRLPLPAVGKIEAAEGFESAEPTLEDGWLVTAAPLLPGQSEYQLVYRATVNENRARVVIVAPTDTARFVLLTPEAGVTLSGTELQAGDVLNMGQTRLRLHVAKGEGLAAGQRVVAEMAVPDGASGKP